MDAPDFERITYAKVAARLIPFLFLCYIFAFLNRVNVGFAKLQMAGDLQFSDIVYSAGAGIFFIGYFVFEVPSNIILERVGARLWIARIMITWGFISSAMMFTDRIPWGPIAPLFGLNDAEFTFYFLRFMLGVAEAGFFPGIILYLTYWFPSKVRASKIALLMMAIPMSAVIGAPISGGIMQFLDGVGDWRGWQWLFFLEGIPSVLMGLLVLLVLPNGPHQARWLNEGERSLVLKRIAEDQTAKSELGQGHSWRDAFSDGRVWVLSVVYFCGTVCGLAMSFWLPTIVQELGVDKSNYLKVGLISMIPWGIAAIVMVINGHHSDRTGERRWHSAWGLLAALAGMLLLTIDVDTGMIGSLNIKAIIGIVGLTLVTTGIMSWVGCFWSLPTAFLSGTAAAAGIAWISSVGNLGGYVGPMAIGWVRENYNSSEAAFYALGSCALIGALIIIFMPGPRGGKR